MIRINDHHQAKLFDPWDFLSPKRRKLLDDSWAGLFQKEILCELPVHKLTPFFNEDFGRPSKELYTVFGVLILQQALDFSDEETLSQLAFNIQWHYALNITEESDSAKYMSPKSLWNFRRLFIDHELDAIVFDAVNTKLSEVFQVDPSKQRIDSVHIQSNMRRLGRIRIFSTSIHKFLVNLKRGHAEAFSTVPPEIVGKYLSPKGLQCFSMVKPSESGKTLSEVGNDLFCLVQQFKDCSEVINMHSYKMLERVLREQCHVKDDDNAPTVEVKKPREIPSDSLQNPSDPDAAYSGHKGQGYQVQVMETYTDTEDEEVRRKTLNLITHVEVQPACQSDAQALIPAIKTVKERNLCPKEVDADTLYGSDANFQAAKAKGVELIAPVMGRTSKKGLSLSDFEFSDNGHVIKCPQGHAPVTCKCRKKRYVQLFDSQTCANCPLAEDCPVKAGKKNHILRYTDKDARIAKRRAYEQTDEFKERYRFRAGIEATMSEYDKRTGVKRLRVRGLGPVRFAATLKAVGVNIFRATAVGKAVNSVQKTIINAFFMPYCLKKAFQRTFGVKLTPIRQSFRIMIQKLNFALG